MTPIPFWDDSWFMPKCPKSSQSFTSTNVSFCVSASLKTYPGFILSLIRCLECFGIGLHHMIFPPVILFRFFSLILLRYATRHGPTFSTHGPPTADPSGYTGIPGRCPVSAWVVWVQDDGWEDVLLQQPHTGVNLGKAPGAQGERWAVSPGSLSKCSA